MDDLRRIEEVRQIAKSKGIHDEIYLSTRKGKRFVIHKVGGMKIHFGQYPLKQGAFIDHKDEKLRQDWRARNKDKKISIGSTVKARLYPYSALHYDWELLWWN